MTCARWHCDGVCRLAGQAQGDEEAGVALVEGERRLPVGAKEHEVGLSVAWGFAVCSCFGALGQGPSLGDEGCGTAALASLPAAFGLGPGQVMAPGVVLLAGELGVDEAVDALVRDDRTPWQNARRPAPGDQPWLRRERTASHIGVSRSQPETPPTAGLSLLVGIGRLIALGT